MPKRKTDPRAPFAKNEKVVAVVDLPGVPAGTAGRVKMSNGFVWERYWVFFENGVQLGHIDRSLLSRPRNQKLRKKEVLEIRESRLARRKELLEQQEHLLDLFLNPPAAEAPKETPAEVPAEAAAENVQAAASESSGNGSSADAPAAEPAPAEPAPVSKGSSLVEVPEHLLQRSAEARARLSS